MATPIAPWSGRRRVYGFVWRAVASPAIRLFLILFAFTPPLALAQANIAFEKHTVDADFDGMHAVEAADLDGDGDIDLFGAAMNASQIVWWQNADGAGTSWNEYVVAPSFASARYVIAADLDGDADLDLVGAGAVADAILWWENTDGQAGAWQVHTVTDSLDFAIHVRPADLDGDGDLDLVAAALRADAVVWWENTDGLATSWIERAIDTSFNGARHVMPADLDGDGDLDVLGAADIGDEVVWWENTGGPGLSWIRHNIATAFDGANSAHAVDLDGDGDLDVLGSADAADQVVWWENDGTGAWPKHVIAPAFNGAFSTFVADLDGDLDPDVIAAAAEGDLIAWWENLAGDAGTWVEHPIQAGYDFATHVCAADLDGDGDRDVIGGRFGGEVAWWENASDVPVLPVELTRFDAIASGHRVALRWETASETANAGFEIQHEASGSFVSVAFVEGAGTTDERRQYVFEMTVATPGRHVFRLKQLDLDGRFTYSPARAVEVGIAGPYRSAGVYPNPFNPRAEFTLSLAVPQQVEVSVFDASGRRVAVLHQGPLDADRSYGFAFDASALPGGLYLFRATGERFVATQTAMLVK